MDPIDTGNPTAFDISTELYFLLEGFFCPRQPN